VAADARPSSRDEEAVEESLSGMRAKAPLAHLVSKEQHYEAVIPRPEANLLLCHGLLAARARWRKRVVAYGRAAAPLTGSAPEPADGPERGAGAARPRYWAWAALMERAFALDVLVCPHCGGRLRLIATLHDPVVIRKILAHVGRSESEHSPGPAPPAS